MNLLYKLIILAFISALSWGGITGYHRIDESSMGIVEEIETGIVVKIFYAKHNFIWQGVLPNIYRVKRVSRIISMNLDVSIRIPPLTDISDERYFIKIPVSFKLKTDPAALLDIQLVSGTAEKLTRLTKEECERGYRSEFGPGLEWGYRRELLMFKAEEIRSRVKERLAQRFRGMGFELTEFFESRANYPDYNVYNEGIKYQNEITSVKMAQDREMLSLKSSIERDKIKNRERFTYLTGMSKLIKENPELLKYIYIDKLGDDVKVVISSDKDLVPGFLKTDEAKPAKKIEIDNLR